MFAWVIEPLKALFTGHWKLLLSLLLVGDLLFGGNFYIPAGGAKLILQEGTPGTRRLVVVCDGFLGYALQRFWNAWHSFGGADVLYVNPKGWKFSRRKRVNAIVQEVNRLDDRHGYDEIVFMGLSAGVKEAFDAMAILGKTPALRIKIKGFVLVDPDWDWRGVRGPGKVFRWIPITSGVTGNALLFWVPRVAFVGIGKHNPHQNISARTPMSMLTSQARNAASSAPTGKLWAGLNFVIVRCPPENDKVLDGKYSSGHWHDFLLRWSDTGEIPVLTVPGAEHVNIDVLGSRWSPNVTTALRYISTGRLTGN